VTGSENQNNYGNMCMRVYEPRTETKAHRIKTAKACSDTRTKKPLYKSVKSYIYVYICGIFLLRALFFSVYIKIS
jgi:hypothetical protein